MMDVETCTAGASLDNKASIVGRVFPGFWISIRLVLGTQKKGLAAAIVLCWRQAGLA